ncbi:hypothetical protein GW17_00015085 [Ensete ventricosum]|nr:hypothetical protein GW17_00015085 [Ensete ventricosum]
MVGRTRRVDPLVVPLTAGGWRHGRANATGRPACNAPDNERLAAWQSKCDGYQPAAPLTVGDWRHGRANATGRSTCNTPDSRYVGLSSTGITFKSSSASYGSGSFQTSDRYGSGSREGDSFRDSYKGEQYGKESKWKHEKQDGQKSQVVDEENEGIKSKKQVSHHSRYTKVAICFDQGLQFRSIPPDMGDIPVRQVTGT